MAIFVKISKSRDHYRYEAPVKVCRQLLKRKTVPQKIEMMGSDGYVLLFDLMSSKTFLELPLMKIQFSLYTGGCINFLCRNEHKKLQKLVASTDDVETPNIIQKKPTQKRVIKLTRLLHYRSQICSV